MSGARINSNVIVPLKLDAFVFNPAVCSGEADEAKIAPITQPNYTFLRLDNFVVQNDILNHVDLHNTTPPEINPRLTDLGTGKVRQRRLGVYLHWMIPRTYRTGAAATESVENKDHQRQKTGLNSSDDSAPNFRPVPPRWLVIRRLDMKTISPERAPIPEVQAWVVESDRRWSINDRELDRDTDLQVDVSPFIYPSKIVNIEQQAEVFIGYKTDAKEWVEKGDQVPRVPLSLLNSGNHLFADYQPHNSNVFSIVDNFEYTGADGKPKYLEKATASYYVVGWHSSKEQDLFFIPDEKDKPTREQRLDACKMTFSDKKGPGVTEWLQSRDTARLLCHGAMYNVEWDVKTRPSNRPADIYSKHIHAYMPVAVGTTPLDSILAFAQAHAGKDTGDLKKLHQSILRIQSLLIAQDDGVESQREAVDMLYNHSYDSADCGTHFYLSGTNTGGEPTEPSEADKKKLAQINQKQFAIDLAARTVLRLRWEMFSWWWKYVSDVKGKAAPDKYINHARTLTARLNTLIDSIKILENEVKDLRAQPGGTLLGEPGVLPSSYKQRDPTLLVGGIGSGWSYDYLELLKVRLDTEIVTGNDNSPPPEGWGDLIPDIIKEMPEALRGAAKKLTDEFLLLRPEGPLLQPQKNQSFPLYHDQGWHPKEKQDAPWRDRWEKTQPWFPLFLEWQVEYTHIPWKYWSLDERTSRQSTGSKLRYGIKDEFTLYDHDKEITDHRTISGRVLILPQPNFSLKAKIEQLFSNTPKDILNKYLSKEDREELEENLYQLNFLSSPLAGLTDHLLTLVQGTHIKPNARPPGQKLEPIQAAIDVGVRAGFNREQLVLIDKESDLTPYGSLVNFLNEKICPFKPVTHGQFKFTKLNIIDKFGQAIHAIDPKPSLKGPPPFYPCISEFYACQSVRDKPMEANTVEKCETGLCEFVQLPPQINQLCRLNSTFVEHDKTEGNSYWKPVTEWENPIWGWIVINFAEYGIQIFLPDGNFYREVRFGGPEGVTQSPAWLPFPPPEKMPDTTQLDKLLQRLTNRTYLQAFVDMINQSLAFAPAAPSAYAQFLNSVVGKPLALANMGWSLELAVNEYINQSTLAKQDPETWLLPAAGGAKRALYDFDVKLGDKDRVYDGLVGYFKVKDVPKPGDELNLDKIYTFFRTGVPGTTLEDIGKESFKPFWISPYDQITERLVSPESIINARNSKLEVFGAIMDPFTPIHGYSGFLPIKTLALPPWTWQKAMNKMTAFFHMGPLLVTQDVPRYKKEDKLESDYKKAEGKPNPNPTAALPSVPTVSIPALGLADWSWLQPYVDPESASVNDGRVYTSLPLGKLDNRPRFEKAPYTAIEGYLQLKKPIVRPAVEKTD